MLPQENLIPWRRVRRWECTHCGYCCEEYDVPLTFEEEEKLRKFGGVFAKGKIGVYLKKMGGTCIFRRNGRCAIYDFRPIACVRYPFFFREDGCEEAKFVFDNREFFVYLDKNCRGIGRGKRVEEEIKRVIERVLLTV